MEKLKQVPVSDLAAWRGASREAAGLFAAWSRRFEREQPRAYGGSGRRIGSIGAEPAGDPAPSRTRQRTFAGLRRSWPNRS